MASSDLAIDTVSALIGSNAKKSPGASNFKNLFIFIADELRDLGVQMADQSKEGITIDGLFFENKNATGALFALQRYTTKLENINSFASDLLAKFNSINEQASKMISG